MNKTTLTILTIGLAASACLPNFRGTGDAPGGFERNSSFNRYGSTSQPLVVSEASISGNVGQRVNNFQSAQWRARDSGYDVYVDTVDSRGRWAMIGLNVNGGISALRSQQNSNQVDVLVCSSNNGDTVNVRNEGGFDYDGHAEQTDVQVSDVDATTRHVDLRIVNQDGSVTNAAFNYRLRSDI